MCTLLPQAKGLTVVPPVTELQVYELFWVSPA